MEDYMDTVKKINPIVKNIRTKFGWSLNEYCLRRGLDDHVARNVAYKKVGKQLRGDKSTEVIETMSRDGVYAR
jgi:hypothetical protein